MFHNHVHRVLFLVIAVFCFGRLPLNAADVEVPAGGLLITDNTSDSYYTTNTDTSHPSVLTFQKNGDFYMNGHITGNIALSVNTSGAYLQMNSGANDFTGGTTITSGKLSLKTGTELGTGTITMSPGTHLMNYNNGSKPVVSNNIVALSGGNITIRAGWNGSNYPTSRSTITVNGVISGEGGVNFGYEPTPGVMTINGANTYTGGTVITTDNMRTDNAVPLKALYLVLGSDTPFSTGPVRVSGKWDNGSTDLKTYFALDNTTTDRNVTVGDLTIEGGRTLKLVQQSATSGKTAELTVNKLLGNGTISNRIDDVATYGNPLNNVNINLQTTSRTEYPIVLDGDFDLYINYKYELEREFIFSSPTDVTSTYTGDIYILSGIVGSKTGTNMGSGTIHLYNGTHLMNYAECIPVYKNNIVLEGNPDEGYAVIRSGWGSTAHQPEGVVLDGVISGAGKLAYTSEATPGLTTINRNNTYTGGTLIAFNMRSDNRYQGGAFQLGSDMPFGTGNVQLGMSGAYPTTYFILDNTTEARNVTIPALTIAGDSPNQKLVLTQRDVSEGAKAANITLKGLPTGKELTLTNVVTDTTLYGNPIKAVTIGRDPLPGGRTGYNIRFEGDYDLYINDNGGRDKELGIQNNYDATNKYTGNIYLQKGMLGTSNGLNLGSGKIFMSSGTTLMNFNPNTNIQITNDIDVTGSVNIRGGWGGSYYGQSFLRLSGDISGTGKIDFGSEPTPVILMISGNNTYSGGTVISNYNVSGNNRYPYNYLVLQSDSPFGTGTFTVDNASVRWDFDALTTDRQLKNDVTINANKTLNITSVGANTSYLNGTYTVNGTLQLVNPTSATVVPNPEQHLQALAVPDGNISRFSLSPKDENSQAAQIIGNLKLEGGSSIQVSGTYNGQELPTITGTLTMDSGSELILDASNVADPDQFLMNINDISMAEGSLITLIPNTSEDFNKLIDFGTSADLSQLKFGDAGGYVFQVVGNELWAIGGGAVPEPSTWALLLIGLLGLALKRKK